MSRMIIKLSFSKTLFTGISPDTNLQNKQSIISPYISIAKAPSLYGLINFILIIFLSQLP